MGIRLGKAGRPSSVIEPSSDGQSYRVRDVEKDPLSDSVGKRIEVRIGFIERQMIQERKVLI